ncbi:unnamed protein product, partial [Tenebrio molitor]
KNKIVVCSHLVFRTFFKNFYHHSRKMSQLLQPKHKKLSFKTNRVI